MEKKKVTTPNLLASAWQIVIIECIYLFDMLQRLIHEVARGRIFKVLILVFYLDKFGQIWSIWILIHKLYKPVSSMEESSVTVICYKEKSI